MQIKQQCNTTSHPFRGINQTKPKTDNTKHWKRYRVTRTHTLLGENRTTLKTTGKFVIKLNIHLPYEPTFPLLGNYTR